MTLRVLTSDSAPVVVPDPYTSVHLLFFFNDTATTEIYTLSLHDALPTWIGADIIRSASSSISSTTYGMRSGPVRDSLYFSMFRAVARAKRRYRRSISPIAQYSEFRILS